MWLRHGNRLIVALLATVLCESAAHGGDAPQAAQAAPDGPADFRKHVVPFLQKHCTGCHAGEKAKAGLVLERFADTDEAAALKSRAVWENVAERLEAGEMPPQDRPRPAKPEVERVTRWITSRLAAIDRDAPKDPGRVTIRRLNRAEYNNTIRDLLGVDFKPAEDFPSDDVGYGFDNIGDVLSLPPVLLEKYLAAAEQIAERTIVAEVTPKSQKKKIEAEQMEAPPGSRVVKDRARILTQSGELRTDYAFPAEAEYIVRARAYAQQAGPEPARMTFRIDRKDIETVDVTAVEASPAVFTSRTKVTAGSKRVAVAFINDYYKPDDPNPANRDRNLIVDYVEIVGPLGLEPKPLPESHKRIIPRRPTDKNRQEVAGDTLTTLASRAYRRPATADEVKRLLRFVDIAIENGDSFEAGIQLALEAILVSPHFLFRVELDHGDPKNPAATRAIDDYELASRLSYFLWSSMPDEELFRLARDGKLRQNLEAQVRRMLKDSKSQALVENFADQWLQIRNLKTVAPDPARFPAFNDELRAAMQRETELFFDAIMRDDRSVLDFLDADFTFLNERLARHYGIPGVQGDEFRRVTLPREPSGTGSASGTRGGVLTQASVLTVTSNPTRTSPVKRGRWVLEQLLGTPPPPPPGNVPELSESPEVELSGTLRQRMEQHRTDPNCAVCHSKMDPLGFGLENFDAIGAWRTEEGKFPIDASGTLPSGESFRGPAELKAILKARDKEFRRCLTQKMLTYALGRGTERHDRPAINEICDAAAQNGNRFSSLVVGIVQSDPFQKRRGKGAE